MEFHHCLDNQRFARDRHRLEPLGKKKTRDKYLADLAKLDPERREQLLGRLNPKLAMEVRQQLMLRYGMS